MQVKDDVDSHKDQDGDDDRVVAEKGANLGGKRPREKFIFGNVLWVQKRTFLMLFSTDYSLLS